MSIKSDTSPFIDSLRIVLVLCGFLATTGLTAQEINALRLDPLSGARATVALAKNDQQPLPLTNWVLRRSDQLAKRIPDAQHRLTLLRNIQWQANRHKLEADLILALIEIESGYDPEAVSRAGARGLMQIMPFWTSEIGKPGDNLFDIRLNIAYGTAILDHYLEVESNNLTRALARYNGSQGKTWYPERIYKAKSRGWDKLYSPPAQVERFVSAPVPTLTVSGKCGNAPGFQICWE